MKSDETVLVVGALPPAAESAAGETLMMSVRVPLEAIRANMKAVLAQWTEVFRDVEEVMKGARVEHVDLSLTLSVDGSVGVWGSKIGSEAKGAITVRLMFDTAAEASSPLTRERGG